MRRAFFAFVLLAAGTVRAGPPAICWQIEIGDAKSLPWGGKDAFEKEKSYDSRRVVDEVLGIASFTNGVILGVFLLGALTVGVGRRGAFVGMAIGASVMLAVKTLTPVNWQWYVLIGSLTTFAAGVAASRLLDPRDA